MMDTSKKWQNRLTAAFQVVREKIGKELQPYFQALVEWAVQNMPKIVEKVEEIGPAIESTLDFLADDFRDE
jgi:glycerol kinase